MEDAIRLWFFVGIFSLLGLYEWFCPKRNLIYSKIRRWKINLGFSAINALFLRLAFGAVLIQTSLMAQNHGMGILSLTPLPTLLLFLVGFVLMDMFMFLFHLLAHAIPVLWRLHRVHHSDLDFDITTAIRFHPLEILVSTIFKMGIILFVGPMPITVLVFEIALNGGALFSHANISLPTKMDRFLRWVIVTPDMHRIHHSVIPKETNSNYGFFLSIWDRLFLTYQHEPQEGQEKMDIGIPEFRSEEEVGFIKLLEMPFVEEPEAISERILSQRS